MTDRTKSRVSARVVELDLRAARATARIACGELLQKIRDETRHLGNALYGDITWKTIPSRIVDAAKSLQTAADTMHALEMSETRERLELVNQEHITLYRTEDGIPLCPVCGKPLFIDVSKRYERVLFAITPEGSSNFNLDNEVPNDPVIERIRCSHRGALHLWIDDPQDREITWQTVESAEKITQD